MTIYEAAAYGGTNRTRLLLGVAALLTIVTLRPDNSVAQTPKRAAVEVAKTGSLEGDVYLVMQNGDTKRGAGRTVFLLRDTPALRVGVITPCTTLAARIRYVADSLAIPRLGARDSTDPYAIAVYVNMANPDADKGVAFADQARLAGRATRPVIEVALLGALVDTAGSGMTAHYRFEKIPAGQYVLFATWEIGSEWDQPYHWWAPVALSPAQHAIRDLDNAVVSRSWPYCDLERIFKNVPTEINAQGEIAPVRSATPALPSIEFMNDASPAVLAAAEFMTAVRDGSLFGMAKVWGSKKGSVLQTEEWGNVVGRLEAVRNYLLFDHVRVALAPSSADTVDRQVSVVLDMSRGKCTTHTGLRMIQAPDNSWIVNSIDTRWVVGFTTCLRPIP